jgi:ParB/RepB/Spo0J family partition protein
MAKWKATSVASQIDYQRPIKKIPISMIKEIEWVPKRRNLGDIASLAKSMMVKGDVEVPVKVRPSRDGLYELVWGWRRYQAAKLAGLNEISCIVDNVSDAELFRQMAIENLLREDRNIVEEAELFRLWSSKTGKSYEEIARDLGINPRYIYNRVELLIERPINAIQLRIAISSPTEADKIIWLAGGTSLSRLLKISSRKKLDPTRIAANNRWLKRYTWASITLPHSSTHYIKLRLFV